MLSITVINFDTLVYIYVLSMSLPGLLILLYSFKVTKPIVWPTAIISTKENKRKISQYIGYGVLMGASGSIVLYLDTLMLHKLLPENSIDLVGIYSMMFSDFFILRFAQIFLHECCFALIRQFSL